MHCPPLADTIHRGHKQATSLIAMSLWVICSSHADYIGASLSWYDKCTQCNVYKNCRLKLWRDFPNAPVPKTKTMYNQVKGIGERVSILPSKRTCERYMLRQNGTKVMLNFTLSKTYKPHLHSKGRGCIVSKKCNITVLYNFAIHIMNKYYVLWTGALMDFTLEKSNLCPFHLAINLGFISVDTWTFRIIGNDLQKIPC